MPQDKGELKLTYSCILSHNNEKIVQVTFERNGAYAEGCVPEGKIEKQEGFTREEIEQMEVYLKENKADIMKKAKEITGFRHWFLQK